MRITPNEARKLGYKPNGNPGEWLAPSNNTRKPMLIYNVMTETEGALYEALQYCLTTLEDEFPESDRCNHPCFKTARAVLAKAEGK